MFAQEGYPSISRHKVLTKTGLHGHSHKPSHAYTPDLHNTSTNNRSLKVLYIQVQWEVGVFTQVKVITYHIVNDVVLTSISIHLDVGNPQFAVVGDTTTIVQASPSLFRWNKDFRLSLLNWLKKYKRSRSFAVAFMVRDQNKTKYTSIATTAKDGNEHAKQAESTNIYARTFFPVNPAQDKMLISFGTPSVCKIHNQTLKWRMIVCRISPLHAEAS